MQTLINLVIRQFKDQKFARWHIAAINCLLENCLKIIYPKPIKLEHSCLMISNLFKNYHQKPASKVNEKKRNKKNSYIVITYLLQTSKELDLLNGNR